MSYIDGTGNIASQPPSTSTSDVGRIVMWPTATPPPGYLLCDGSPIPAQYGGLIAVVGANTPDLRGKFLRSSSGSHAVGTILASGTAQPAKGKPSTAAGGQHNHSTNAVGNHTHGGQYGLNASGSGAEVLRAGPNDGINGNWSGFGKIRPGGSHSHLLNGNGGHTHTLTGYDPETVPDNVRVAYIIKAA